MSLPVTSTVGSQSSAMSVSGLKHSNAIGIGLRTVESAERKRPCPVISDIAYEDLLSSKYIQPKRIKFNMVSAASGTSPLRPA